jgi:poly(A) polymerase
MDKLDLLIRIIPELDVMKGVEQPKEHYWNVFEHSMETVATTAFLLREDCWKYTSDDLLKRTPWSTDISRHFDEEISSGSNRRILLKLGSLLHDIAKPTTKSIDEKGKMRFFGHGKLGASIVAPMLERLRFSSREIKLVQNLVYHHLRPAQMSNEGLPTSRAIYRYFRDTEGAGIDILFLALADYLATSGPNLNVGEWNQHNEMINFILSEHGRQETEVIPVNLIDGHDIMCDLNISPGPLVGELLSEVREAQIAGDLRTREEAIAFIHRCMEKRNKNYAS